MSRVISYREVYENNNKQILLSEEQYNVLKMDNVQLSVLVNERNKEIERLNNIIKEIKKYTKEEIKKWKEEEKIENDYSTRANILGYITGMENVQDKIKELKGVDKE